MSEAARTGSAEPERAAFYALSPGGWRDYWSLLHPPYTLWHLSYVAIGAALAPSFNGLYLGASLLAFFLAVGLSAHALDELNGRPLRTRIPSGVLVATAVAGLAGAVALGVAGAARVSPWLLVFIPVGAFLVPAYNLEWFGGLFHNDTWFALAWGAFPALVGYFAQSGEIGVPAIATAVACALLSAAQRRLSTPVRKLRRRVRRVEGELSLADGSTERLDASALRAAPEAALRIMSLAMVALASAMVAARIL
ncbi:MAG: hypothetical protein WD276_03145 [Actinomycetota bacterium]